MLLLEVSLMVSISTSVLEVMLCMVSSPSALVPSVQVHINRPATPMHSPPPRQPVLHCCYQLHMMGAMHPWPALLAPAGGASCWGLLVVAWSDGRGEALCGHCLPVMVPLVEGPEGPAAAGGPMVPEGALGLGTADPALAVDAGQGIPLAQAVVRLSMAVHAALSRTAGKVECVAPCHLFIECLGAALCDQIAV